MNKVLACLTHPKSTVKQRGETEREQMKKKRESLSQIHATILDFLFLQLALSLHLFLARYEQPEVRVFACVCVCVGGYRS